MGTSMKWAAVIRLTFPESDRFLDAAALKKGAKLSFR